MLDSTDQVHAQQDGPLLRNAVIEWLDESLPEQVKKPLFITVMKNHSHLERLRDLLDSADLSHIPALVIDDEADQAGLNTQPSRSTASTTYRRIQAVRRCLPNHSYVQYTATPQAPLLISLTDMLSPDFVEVINPGAGYTGGLVFFASESPHVRNIPGDDLFSAGDPPSTPPESLIEALRLYFVGVAASRLRDSAGPRSMLVHPSQRQADHRRFVGLIEAIITRWRGELRAGAADPDFLDLIQEFREAYGDLAQTCDDLPPFDDDFVQTLRLYIGRTIVNEVNSEDGREVDWDNGYSHILVGGEKLNRGYTVKGLTITYMPRGAGGWNADTIQQRARFLGYKEAYLGLCRVYLHPDVAQAYRDYVIHENDIRSQLVNHRDRPLNEWKRAFFLDARMGPTRRNVLSDPYFRLRRVGWFRQTLPHADPGFRERNRDRVTTFLEGLEFLEHPRFSQHGVAYVPLANVLERLLVDYEVEGSSDVVGLYSARCWIGDVLLSAPDTMCCVVSIMNGRPRIRTEESGTSKLTLHEGRRPGGGYAGDAHVRDDNVVTVQIHHLDVNDGSIPDIYALAIWVPAELRTDEVIVQPTREA